MTTTLDVPYFRFRHIHFLYSDQFILKQWYLISFSLSLQTTLPSRIQLTTRIQIYRCLQVLEKELNHFGSTQVIPSILIMAPIVQIFCTFVLIKLFRTLPSEGIMTYPYLILIAVTACMVFETFAAQLLTKSAKQCGDWKMEKNLSKVNRKAIISLQPMRIKMGNNFIDRSTALVTQDFCITQTVSLLLM